MTKPSQTPQSERDDGNKRIIRDKLIPFLENIWQKYLFYGLEYVQSLIIQRGQYLDLSHASRTLWHLPHQGAIYMTQLDPSIGGELQKTRPCIIYSVTGANRGDCVVCIPIKTLKKKPKHIYRVKLHPTTTNGLNQLSYCSLITEIERIHNFISKLFGLEKKEIVSLPSHSDPHT